MHALVQSKGFSSSDEAQALRNPPPPTVATNSDAAKPDCVQDLSPGDSLFLQGEIKQCIYRIEDGVVALSLDRPGGGTETIGFAFPGDLVGAGALERHMWNAHASLPCRVSRLLPEAADAIAAVRPEVRKRIAETSGLEFEVLRDQLNGQGRLDITHRLAALLLAIASSNAHEGREADTIRDDIQCGLIADMLGIEVAELGHGLIELKRNGLVDLDRTGALRLVDRPALEKMLEAS